MSLNPYDSYIESAVLTADPMELVSMLIGGGLEAIARSRAALAAGDIAGRSKEIVRAVSILTELSLSVDRNRAPELGRNLIELYDYMQRRLLEANASQQDAPLAEVERLLSTLREGWNQCRSAVLSESRQHEYEAVRLTA
ncbi:MAG: flagellar export chaperone FliS [Bryobacteraceae bacterium]|nr:flagellar export chaperone FliS [Bryobacteraceae bacterium]